MMKFSLGCILALFCEVSQAAMQAVQVGQGGLMYSPSTVTAAAGDTVQFTFNGAHSVTQSTFSDPCSGSGLDSGVMSSGTFTVTVNDTNPIWIHCSVPGHCQAGMVMAINPPTSGQTFAAFQDAAEGKAAPSSADASSSTSSTMPSGSSMASGSSMSSGSSTASAASIMSSTSVIGSATSAAASATQSGAAPRRASLLGVEGSLSVLSLLAGVVLGIAAL